MKRVVKLVDLFNTKYFYKTFVKDAEYLFNSILQLQKDPSVNPNAETPQIEELYTQIRNGDDIEIDLSDAVYTRDFANLLNDWITKINFCAPTNPALQRMLSENVTRISNSKVQTVDFPAYNVTQSIPAYMKSLQPGVVYNSNTLHSAFNMMSDDDVIYFLILLTGVRPDLTINYNQYLLPIAQMITTIIPVLSYDNTEFLFVSPDTGVQKVTKDNFQVYGIDKIDSFADLLKYGYLIPNDFGTAKLNRKATQYRQDQWRQLMSICIDKVDTMMTKSSKSIFSVLDKLGVSND